MTAPSLWDIPSQQHAAEVLRGAVQRNEVGHAWALLGPAGVGQDRVAAALVASLNCREERGGCGSCGVCDRALRGVHAGYREFAPTGVAHRVADVRERWLPEAWRTAIEGGWKVLRVLAADRMNEAAANAFLKGLEEPPPSTVWLLDIADPDELPDTILSRCRIVRFVSWGQAELDAEATRLGIDDAAERALAVRAALGSPTALRRFASAGGLDRLRAHREFLTQLRSGGPGYSLLAARMLDDEVKVVTTEIKADTKARLADLVEAYGEEVPRPVARQVEEQATRREREARTQVFQGALDDLLGWLRDCLAIAGGAPPEALIHADDADALRADADVLGPAGLLKAAALVQATRDELELNVQQGLAIEALLLELSTLQLTATTS